MKILLLLIFTSLLSSCGLLSAPVAGTVSGGHQLTKLSFQNIENDNTKYAVAPFTFIAGTAIGGVCSFFKTLNEGSYPGDPNEYSFAFFFWPGQFEPFGKIEEKKTTEPED